MRVAERRKQYVKWATSPRASGPSPARVVFVHGGAWRDPANTSMDFEKWALAMTGEVVSVDYRLAPEHAHPSQLDDVAEALGLLPPVPTVLCGHSVGATLICQLVEANRLPQWVRGIVLLEGIYSMRQLLSRYPDYAGFVHEEFARGEAFDVMDMDRNKSSQAYRDLAVTLVHSREDELLDWSTSKCFVDWLQHSGVDVTVVRGDFGKHNDVYVNEEVRHLVEKVANDHGMVEL